MSIILVLKRSVLEQRHQNPESYGTVLAADQQLMEECHLAHRATVDAVLAELGRIHIKPWVVDGADTNFIAGPDDKVVTVGGDGTVLSASHACGALTPLLAFNSDPGHSVGRFCNARIEDLALLLEKDPPLTFVPRMRVEVNGALISQRVLNEVLFSHSCPAAMTKLTIGEVRFACSGVWIGTSAGSTGALHSAGGKIKPITEAELQLIVREPFNTDVTHQPVFDTAFEAKSHILDGTLYMDGPFLRVPVGFGQNMKFMVSDEPLRMIGTIR